MSRFPELLLCLAFVLSACGESDAAKNDDRSSDASPAPVTEPKQDSPPNPEPPPAPQPLPGVASKNAVYRVDVQWVKGPDFEDEDNQVRIYFFTPGGKPAAAVKIEDFHPWMTSMGHGAPTIDLEWTVEDAAQPHVFLVKGLMFTMGGSWDLVLDAIVEGTSDKATFAVEIPQ